MALINSMISSSSISTFKPSNVSLCNFKHNNINIIKSFPKSIVSFESNYIKLKISENNSNALNNASFTTLPPKTRTSRLTNIKCSSTANVKPPNSNQMLVFVPPHPLIKHWIAVLRNESTPPAMFRSALAELGRLLIYEASRDFLPITGGQVQTPCGISDVEFIDPREPIIVVPILRAGLVLVENLNSVLPSTITYHIGYARDEKTLLPSMYFNKLPEKFDPSSKIFIVDPMLATGGTISSAIGEILNRGIDIKNLRVISAICATPALTLLSKKYPGLKVYTGMIDNDLNDKGFIVPGLGDAGDRSFNT